MDQQQYRMSPGAAPKKRPNRFLRIWGPLLVKWGVGFGVSALAVFVLEGVLLVKKSGIDLQSLGNYAQLQQAMQQYVQDAGNSMELANEVARELMRFTTPIEGLAALITIPILIVMFHGDRVKERIAGYIPNRKAALWKYAGILVISAALTLGLNGLMQISGLSAADESYAETMGYLYSVSFPVQLVCLGVLIPVCEELVFRGLMFRRIRQGSGFMASAVYTSLVFGFLHMNVVQMLYGFFMGMVFCWLYEKYGSVKAPVLAHMMSNVISVVLTSANAMDWLSQDPMRMGVAIVLCAFASSTAYVLIQRIEERPQAAQGPQGPASQGPASQGPAA